MILTGKFRYKQYTLVSTIFLGYDQNINISSVNFDMIVDITI